VTTDRAVERIFASRPTIEGAGVRLKRAFGYYEVPAFDPFLMLDDFHSENPADYVAGFPWHPHRGIETVTYMIRGTVEHGDTLGNRGTIRSGDVQWMTAGGGILHQEMPQPYVGRMQGFQLWVNLPASQKMMRPRYRDIRSSDIPDASPKKGVDVKVIAGQFEGTQGPVKDLVVDTEYIDVSMVPGRRFDHAVRQGNRVFAYVFEGEGLFGHNAINPLGAEHVALFSDGSHVTVRTAKSPVRFLLVSGPPIGEPVAWRGPIVMNTEQELDLAFQEYWTGKFIKA
jgi:redox-sensitive bicupin YhaK (pirin superfamily)